MFTACLIAALVCTFDGANDGPKPSDNKALPETDAEKWPDPAKWPDLAKWPDPKPEDAAASKALYERLRAENSRRSDWVGSVLPEVLWWWMALSLIAQGASLPEGPFRVFRLGLGGVLLAAFAFWAFGFAIGWGNFFNGAAPLDWYAAFGPGVSELNRGWGIGPDPKYAGAFRYGLFGTTGFFVGAGSEPAVLRLFAFLQPFFSQAAAIPILVFSSRATWKGLVPFSLALALPFSLFANWVWGGGWLAQAGVNWGLGHGVVDFSGAGVVYAWAGLTALAACRTGGPAGAHATALSAASSE